MSGLPCRVCKKTERWGAGVVICLEQGADVHMVQLMPLPLTVSCFSKIQIGFTFLVPTDPGSPGRRVVKWSAIVQSCCVHPCEVVRQCPVLQFQSTRACVCTIDME